MQWSICLLHCNELPLRKIFKMKDGGTKGPGLFEGYIGCQLSQQNFLHTLPIGNFKKINGPGLPDIVIKNLSNDQKYLFEIVCAAQSGVISESLKTRKVGKIHTARFITLGSGIIRLYMAEEDPSQQLVELANFVCRVINIFNDRHKMDPPFTCA